MEETGVAATVELLGSDTSASYVTCPLPLLKTVPTSENWGAQSIYGLCEALEVAGAHETVGGQTCIEYVLSAWPPLERWLGAAAAMAGIGV